MGTRVDIAMLACQDTLNNTRRDVAMTLAEAIRKDLKPSATDREIEQLAQAIEFFLG